MKNLRLISWVFFVLLTLLFGGFLTIFNFKTEKFLDERSIQFKTEIRPIFNPKVENYYAKKCNNGQVDIKINNDLSSSIKTNNPVTEVTIKYLKLFAKKYYITCIEPKVSQVDLINAEGKRSEYILMDELVIPNQVNEEFNGTLTLRDSLGTPIWWISPNSTPLKYLNLNFLRDPKLIDKGSKVLFVGSKSPALGTSFDGFYMVYDLKTHKVIKTYTGAKEKNGEGTLDFHDMQILPNGEAVTIRYAKRKDVDLSSIGIAKGTEIIDSEILILNEDGTEKKKISLIDLIEPAEISINQPSYFTPDNSPVDVIHSNAVEVVGDFVYVSSRHLDAIHKINLKDGSIVWKLGGNFKTKYDLTVTNLYGSINQMNNTLALSKLISGQHDVRILDDGQMSIFDNGTTANRNPRVLILKIDEKNKTATITKVITGSSQSVSSCCGSARKLQDGSWFINWGGKFDQSRGILSNSVSSIVLPNGVETRIMVRPRNVFSYRAIPYYLNNEQLSLFRQDLINRN